ncbi:MAG TPA: helix-turn-helix domain-containing protein, partial [Chthoniobacterales bacterium]|nr:helix-turn-helix domain-containing protein [Chthoniobacterales bacterium]
LTDEVMEALSNYDWPGNVRELEHTVQQMVAMNSGPWLTAADLPSTVVNRSLEQQLAAISSDSSVGNGAAGWPINFAGSGVVPLAEVEKRAILHAMEYTKGDRTVAAAMLGIGRTTLYRKLKEYGL